MTSRKKMGLFEYVRVGEIERISQVKMPDTTKMVLMEILAQNRMILQANCSTIRLMGQPMMVISRNIEKKSKGEKL